MLSPVQLPVAERIEKDIPMMRKSSSYYIYLGQSSRSYRREKEKRRFFFNIFFLNCTSRGTKVHSGTPGPMAPGTLKQTHL